MQNTSASLFLMVSWREELVVKVLTKHKRSAFLPAIQIVIAYIFLVTLHLGCAILAHKQED